MEWKELWIALIWITMATGIWITYETQIAEIPWRAFKSDNEIIDEWCSKPMRTLNESELCSLWRKNSFVGNNDWSNSKIPSYSYNDPMGQWNSTITSKTKNSS